MHVFVEAWVWVTAFCTATALWSQMGLVKGKTACLFKTTLHKPLKETLLPAFVTKYEFAFLP